MGLDLANEVLEAQLKTCKIKLGRVHQMSMETNELWERIICLMEKK